MSRKKRVRGDKLMQWWWLGSTVIATDGSRKNNDVQKGAPRCAATGRVSARTQAGPFSKVGNQHDSQGLCCFPHCCDCDEYFMWHYTHTTVCTFWLLRYQISMTIHALNCAQGKKEM